MFSGFLILFAGNLLEYIKNVNWPIFIIGLLIFIAKTMDCIDTFNQNRDINPSKSTIDKFCRT